MLFVAEATSMERQKETPLYSEIEHGGRKATLDLSGFDTIFCDSLGALDAAYDKGLKRSAAILTRSPALVARTDLPSVHLDARDSFDPKVLEEFYLSTSSFLEECLGVLKKDPMTAPFAVLFCREVWIWQQRAAFAAFLRDEDFVEPRLLVEGISDMNSPKKFRLPWRKWLAGNPNLGIFETETALPSGWPAEVENPSLRDRMRLQGIDQILFRVSIAVGNFLPSNITRGQIYYLRESELVRDACVEFAMRGFGVKQIALPRLITETGQHPVCSRTLELFKIRVVDRIEKYFSPKSTSSLLSELVSSFSRQLFSYDATKTHLQDHASRIFRKKKVVFLTNYPFGGSQLALVHTAQERGAVFTGVQHGIGRELLAVRQNECNYENTFARNVIVFNSEAKRITASGAFRSSGGDECVAGVPSDFHRVGRSRSNEDVPPILYAQTLGLAGTFFNAFIYKNDVESSRRDISLITQVFERLPHKVSFKCYPHRSYEDLDPALEAAEKAKNVSLMRTGMDLRYVISSARVVISVGASSTLAWCMGSGKPVIYIDPVSSGYRMRRDIIDNYSEALFYFDERDDEYLEKMRKFLSRSLENIEAEWKEGEERRIAFSDRFFGKVDNRTGHNIANWILAKLPS